MKVAVHRMRGPYFLLKVALGETYGQIFFFKVAGDGTLTSKFSIESQTLQTQLE